MRRPFDSSNFGANSLSIALEVAFVVGILLRQRYKLPTSEIHDVGTVLDGLTLLS